MEPVCKEKATRVQYELHFKKPEKKNGGEKMNVYHQVKAPGMFPVHLRRRLIAWLTDAHKPGSCPCDIIPHS